MVKFMSIIIPIPELEKYTQDYRYMYDFFAIRGSPAHISLIYEISLKKYNENKVVIEEYVMKVLKILKGMKIICNKIVSTKTMLSIGLDNATIKKIYDMQILLICYLGLDKSKYKDRDAHITLFTGINNRGWSIESEIKRSIKLPIRIKVNKLWITEVDNIKNIAHPIQIIK